jgi:dolichol-phosphate mannosyltransferase
MVSLLMPTPLSASESGAIAARRPSNRSVALDLSLILPTYNERENLEKLFARLDCVLAGHDFEAILVDDNSPDGTWAEAERLQEKYAWLRVTRRGHERGLSSAVICGFRQAHGKILAVMDADLQHDESRLPELLQQMDRADFVIATRRAAGGSNGQWNWWRRLTSRVATLLAHHIGQVALSDPMSGFFAIRRQLFVMMDDGTLCPRGYKILLYLYSRAVRQFGSDRLRLQEVGYQFRKRESGRSKLSWKIIFEYLFMLMELRWHSGFRVARPRLSHVAT